MRCPVCSATWPDSEGAKGATCPQCKYDVKQPGADDAEKILAAREKFAEATTAYDPEHRVTTWDRAKPWLSLILGFVIFIFWMRACSTMGWKLW